MKHDFSAYKFRSSCIGKIMTDPRKGSTETVSETTKDYLREVMIQVVYGRRKEIVSKCLIKGTSAEEDSITLLSRIDKCFYTKNEQRLSNDFISGTPDIILQDRVIDIKTRWDIFTFFKAVMSPMEKDYYWQLQAYMALTGRDHAELVSTLVSTPANLIESEKRKVAWNAQQMDEEVTQEALFAVERNMIYDDIPMEERLYRVTVERNAEDIQRMYERVSDCRKWLNENF